MSRDQLYEEIWVEPVQTVAARYGISGVGLAKLCRRHRIPVPGRGYWQQLKAGQPVRRLPLPPPRSGEPEEIIVSGSQRRLSETAEAQMIAEKAPEEEIAVPAVLADPHPEVAMAERSLRSGGANSQGFLKPRAKQRLDIRVTRATLDRALRVMDALVKALEHRGYPVTISDKVPAITAVRVLDEELQFYVAEALNQVDHKPTPHEKAQAVLYSWQRWPKYDHVPSGRLQLRIGNASGLSLRQTWGDGKKVRLHWPVGRRREGRVWARPSPMKSQRPPSTRLSPGPTWITSWAGASRPGA